jgi:hypothetical protein
LIVNPVGSKPALRAAMSARFTLLGLKRYRASGMR